MVQLNNLLSWSCLISLATFAAATPIPYKKEASIIKIPLYKRASNKLARRDGISESLFSDLSEFYANIEVGTPPQNYSIVLDTGSDKFWIQSDGCPVEDCPFKLYDPSESSTAVDANLKLEISYMDGGAAIGEFYYDTVTLAGITLEQQLVGASVQNGTLGLGNGVPNAQPEGLMGFSFAFAINSESNDTYDPFVFQLYKQNKINEPIFSFYYGDITKSGTETGAEITLGGIDSEKYTGEIQYVPVVPDDGTYHYWQSYSQGLNIVSASGTYNVFAAQTEMITAVMDSGTTSINIPTILQEQIYTGMTGLDAPQIYTDAATNETFWQMDCTFVDSTEYNFEVILSHYNSVTETDQSPLILTLPASIFVSARSDNICVWDLSPSDDDELVFGQKFLNYFYTVHNMETREIGFAPAISKNSQVTV